MPLNRIFGSSSETATLVRWMDPGFFRSLVPVPRPSAACVAVRGRWRLQPLCLFPWMWQRPMQEPEGASVLRTCEFTGGGETVTLEEKSHQQCLPVPTHPRSSPNMERLVTAEEPPQR